MSCAAKWSRDDSGGRDREGVDGRDDGGGRDGEGGRQGDGENVEGGSGGCGHDGGGGGDGGGYENWLMSGSDMRLPSCGGNLGCAGGVRDPSAGCCVVGGTRHGRADERRLCNKSCIKWGCIRVPNDVHAEAAAMSDEDRCFIAR